MQSTTAMANSKKIEQLKVNKQSMSQSESVKQTGQTLQLEGKMHCSYFHIIKIAYKKHQPCCMAWKPSKSDLKSLSTPILRLEALLY